MNTFVLLTIILGTIFYIFQPFFIKDRILLDIAPNKKGRNVNLKADYSNILINLKELEFDHKLGNLSTEDFNELNTRYRHEAVTLMKRLEGKNKENKTKQEHVTASKEQHAMQKKASTSFCTYCGSPVGKGYRFCSNCGKHLE